MAQKYTLSHKNFAKIHCFKRTLKGILPHDTLSHNFLINCDTLSHNFYQKRTPCCRIFTVKGHPVERHILSSQVWEYPLGLYQKLEIGIYLKGFNNINLKIHDFNSLVQTNVKKMKMFYVCLNQGRLGPKINRYSEIRKESPPKRGVRSMFLQENFLFQNILKRCRQPFIVHSGEKFLFSNHLTTELSSVSNVKSS